nr:transposase [Nostoc mirabile]
MTNYKITNYFDLSPYEGINNKLKLIKILSYSFHNFENFKLQSLLTWYFGIPFRSQQRG